jgi:hypothetical protein
MYGFFYFTSNVILRLQKQKPYIMKSFIKTTFDAAYVLSPIVILFFVFVMALTGNKGNSKKSNSEKLSVKEKPEYSSASQEYPIVTRKINF